VKLLLFRIYCFKKK